MSKPSLKVPTAAEEDSIFFFHLKVHSLCPLHHPWADPIPTFPHPHTHTLTAPSTPSSWIQLWRSVVAMVLEESLPGRTSHQVLILDGLLKGNLTKIKQKYQPFILASSIPCKSLQNAFDHLKWRSPKFPCRNYILSDLWMWLCLELGSPMRG